MIKHLIKLCEDGIQISQKPSVFPNQLDSETMFNKMPINGHEEELPNQPDDDAIEITRADGQSEVQNADCNMSKSLHGSARPAMGNSPTQNKYNLNNNGEYDRLSEDVCGTGDIGIGVGSFLPVTKKKRKMKKPIREEDAVKKAKGTPISDKSAKPMKFKADSEMSQAGKQWPRKHNETPAMCDVDEDGVEHKPQGVHNSKPAKPEESPLSKVGHDWPAKAKNDGGTFEEFGNSLNGAEVHAGDVNENWSRLEIASKVKGMPKLQTMFDAYAQRAECVTSEEFNHVCQANGYDVNLSDNQLLPLLGANQNFMFREMVDANGRYWLKEEAPPNFDRRENHMPQFGGHDRGMGQFDDDFTEHDLPPAHGSLGGPEMGGDEFGGPEMGGDEFGGDEFGGDIDYSAEFALDEEPPANLEIDIHKDTLGGDDEEFAGGDEFGDHEMGGDEFGGPEMGGDEFGDDIGGPDEFGGMGREGGGLGGRPRGPRFESKTKSRKTINESGKPWLKDEDDDDDGDDEECDDGEHCDMSESNIAKFLKSAKRILESCQGYTDHDIGSALTHAWEVNVGMIDLNECSEPIRKAITAISKSYGNFQPMVLECDAMDNKGGSSVQEKSTKKAVAGPNKSETTELVGNSSLITRKPKNSVDKTPVLDGAGAGKMSESINKKVRSISEAIKATTSQLGQCQVQLSAVSKTGKRLTQPFSTLTEAAAKMIELGDKANLIAVFSKNGKKLTKRIG